MFKEQGLFQGNTKNHIAVQLPYTLKKLHPTLRGYKTLNQPQTLSTGSFILRNYISIQMLIKLIPFKTASFSKQICTKHHSEFGTFGYKIFKSNFFKKNQISNNKHLEQTNKQTDITMVI